MNTANSEMSNAISAQAPAPVEPLNKASVRRGIAQMRLAVGAESFSGAMVYSQNCYDALAREFSWAKLDQCGAADMFAVRSMESAETGELNSEAGYFQSEAAAGRYLAAATGAGEPAAKADLRLSELQVRAAKMPQLKPPSAQVRASDADTGVEPEGDTVSSDSLSNIVEPEGEEADELTNLTTFEA
jgi:hypothetical protein